MDQNVLFDESISLRKKAKLLGISHMAVRRRLFAGCSKKRGRKTMFSADEERDIEALMLRCANLGVPFVDDLQLPTRVLNNFGNIGTSAICKPSVTVIRLGFDCNGN